MLGVDVKYLMIVSHSFIRAVVVLYLFSFALSLNVASALSLLVASPFPVSFSNAENAPARRWEMRFFSLLRVLHQLENCHVCNYGFIAFFSLHTTREKNGFCNVYAKETINFCLLDYPFRICKLCATVSMGN